MLCAQRMGREVFRENQGNPCALRINNACMDIRQKEKGDYILQTRLISHFENMNAASDKIILILGKGEIYGSNTSYISICYFSVTDLHAV